MKMNEISKSFTTIDAKMLDDWFAEKIEKYKNAPMSDHLKMVYLMMTDDWHDTLIEFYDKQLTNQK